MKKSKSSSKDKRKVSSVDSDKKRAKMAKKEKPKEPDDKTLRKSRWETSDTKEEINKQAPCSRTDETLNPEPPRRLKDMLGDKKKIIEYLFLTVTVPTLQDLIPDYLKNRSIEELKNLCYSEIKEMSDEHILDLISDAEKKESEVNKDINSSPKHSSDTQSGDLLELCASSNDMKGLNDDSDDDTSQQQDQVNLDDSRVVESEADLQELEMRARAIRSLLKARSREVPESDESEE